MIISSNGDCGGSSCKPSASPAASLQGIRSDPWTYCSGTSGLSDCGDYNPNQGDYTIVAISCVTDFGPG